MLSPSSEPKMAKLCNVTYQKVVVFMVMFQVAVAISEI
jgi:hypothetical protein